MVLDVCVSVCVFVLVVGLVYCYFGLSTWFRMFLLLIILLLVGGLVNSVAFMFDSFVVLMC